MCDNAPLEFTKVYVSLYLHGMRFANSKKKKKNHLNAFLLSKAGFFMLAVMLMEVLPPKKAISSG